MFSGARCIFTVAIACSGGCDVRAGCCLVVGCAREVLRAHERGTEVRSREMSHDGEGSFSGRRLQAVSRDASFILAICEILNPVAAPLAYRIAVDVLIIASRAFLAGNRSIYRVRRLRRWPACLCA